MWTKLTGDQGMPLFVNPRVLSAIRQPPEGMTGARLALLSGSTVYVRQSVTKLMEGLAKQAPRETGLWLSLTNEFDWPIGLNFERARFVREGPGSFGGSMVLFLPDFSVFVKESPEEIGERLDTHANVVVAGDWIKLTLEKKKRALVNAARIALVRHGPGKGTGSFLTFLSGWQLMVQESPKEILHVIGVERLQAAEKPKDT